MSLTACSNFLYFHIALHVIFVVHGPTAFRRFDPSLMKLKKRVDDGECGTILSVKSVARDHPLPPLDYLRISGEEGCLGKCYAQWIYSEWIENKGIYIAL